VKQLGGAVLAAAFLGAGSLNAQNRLAPTRDPHAPEFVEATELADGAVPPTHVDGNFIIGPHVRDRQGRQRLVLGE
jgi:hypothetical protein